MVDLTALDDSIASRYIRSMTENSIEQLAEPTAQTMTYGGAGGALGAWALSLGDLAAIVGMVIAGVGLCFQIYFGFDRRRRARELHEAQLQHLKEKHDV